MRFDVARFRPCVCALSLRCGTRERCQEKRTCRSGGGGGGGWRWMAADKAADGGSQGALHGRNVRAASVERAPQHRDKSASAGTGPRVVREVTALGLGRGRGRGRSAPGHADKRTRRAAPHRTERRYRAVAR